MTGIKKVLTRLKTLREHNSLSQNVLAEVLGINRSTYVRKELGNIPITTEEWMKLARRMNVEPGYFFDTDGAAVEGTEDGHDMVLLALFRSLKLMEQQDLLTLVVIAFKGIKRKKVREKIALLSDVRRS